MASSKEFVEFAMEQIQHCGIVNFKKMFGEYMVYLNGKPIFLICNDVLYVKISERTAKIIGQDGERGFPYSGAKEHFIVENIDDRTFMSELALALEEITPLPKVKKKKVLKE